MGEIRLLSEIDVHPVQAVGNDLVIVRAARASTTGAAAADPERESPEAQFGLISYLMKNRHGTPFEHGLLTISVHAPAFVWWEWVRHRVAMTVDCNEMSFSLESGRYKQLEPVFWVPRRERKLVPAAGHKPSRPNYEAADDHSYMVLINDMRDAYGKQWAVYSNMIRNGFANEVARAVLGFGVYYSGWVTMNARSLMHFLSLRTHEPKAKFVSRPQAEIEEAARSAERLLESGWPLTYRAFCECGRVGP